MKKMISGLCAATMMLTTFGISLAAAAPIAVPQFEVQKSDAIQVQSRRDRRDRYDRRDRFERRGDSYYYNGRRGYRTKRPGYRYHNGYWFPAAAFIAGAVIGGAVANQPSTRLSSAHVRYCADRYRSYRASDNTFQPNAGPRQQCRSPY